MTDDLKKLAEAEAALGQVIDQRDSYHEWADRLAYAIGGSEIGEHSSINNPWQNAIEMAEDLRTRAEAAEAALSAMTAERDEARKQVNGLRLSQSLDKDSAYVIRELLNRHNVPAATFVDDHVANAIAQRDAAEAALSAAQEDVARLRKQVTSSALDALAADGQAHESYAAAMALYERLTAILDWCDLATDQPGTFNGQGVRLLQGPVFDDARKAVAAYRGAARILWGDFAKE